MDAFFFHFSAASVVPFWFMMIVFPRAGATQKMIASVYIIVPAAICYLYFLMPNIIEAVLAFEKPSAAAVAKLTGQNWGAGMFWAYAGAFDLFVGRWIFLDAQERDIPHLLVAPALFIAIFFGPLGFVLYAMVRAAKKSGT